MVGGRGVRLARESTVKDAELFVCVSLDDRSGPRSEALVRIASAVEREWLPEDRLREATELEFEESRQRVVARRRTRFDDLVLDDKEVPIHDAEAASTLLDRAGYSSYRRNPAARRPGMGGPRGETSIPAPQLPRPRASRADRVHLYRASLLLSGSARSFEELRRAPWQEALLGTLSHTQRTALDSEAPERLEVPSGNRIRVDYSDPARPVLAARIQELFGLAATPRLARGRVPVLLHLLAPNGRPQQITDDLASFWKTTYAEVRKELAARYPRHAWPVRSLDSAGPTSPAAAQIHSNRSRRTLIGDALRAPLAPTLSGG